MESSLVGVTLPTETQNEGSQPVGCRRSTAGQGRFVETRSGESWEYLSYGTEAAAWDAGHGSGFCRALQVLLGC